MTKHTSLIVIMSFSAGCRFGGPDGDLAVLVDSELVVLDARVPDGEAAAARSPALASPAGGAVDPGKVDVGKADAGKVDGGAEGGKDAATVAPDAALQARADASIASCDTPLSLACNPVSGEGCPPFMQCVADPGSSTPAASCIFSGLPLTAACVQDALLTTCPSQHACVDGQCRKYCYCDADCDDGAGCSAASGAGSARFKVCEPLSSGA